MWKNYENIVITAIVFEISFILSTYAQTLSGLQLHFNDDSSVVVSCVATPPSGKFGLPWHFSWYYNNELLLNVGVLKNYNTYAISTSNNVYSGVTSIHNEPSNVAHTDGHAFTSRLKLSPFSIADLGHTFMASIGAGVNVSSQLIISECTNSRYIISSQSSTPCLTGCKAVLSCQSGMPGIKRGTCQPNGYFLPHPNCSSIPLSSFPIHTLPPSPDNILVTGFAGLIVRALFVKGNNTVCSWRYQGELDHAQFYISSFGGCTPRAGTREKITCTEEQTSGEIRISSNLTFTKPLNIDLDIFVECDSGKKLILPKKKVQHCRPSLLKNVTVVPSFASYGSTGKFTCANYGKLFHPNGSEPTEMTTSCLVTAQWDSQGELECWKAPHVSIDSNLTVLDGRKLSITCNYQDEYPVGDHSVFQIGDVSLRVPKRQPLILASVQRKDDKKSISCQAITPYTKKYNENGRARELKLSVLYAPYQTTPTTCVWVVQRKERCDVTILSNSRVEYVTLTKYGSSASLNLIGLNFERLPTSVDDNYTFTFTAPQVQPSHEGKYFLAVRSSQFPEQRQIIFYINVLDNSPAIVGNDDNEYYSIVIISLVAAFFTVSTVCLTADKLKKKCI